MWRVLQFHPRERAKILHTLFFFVFQDRAKIKEKLSFTGRAVVDLSFAEISSLAGNCFELTDGSKRFLAISKVFRRKFRKASH